MLLDKILYVILCLALIYYTYRDLKYREMKRRYIICMYPIVLYLNYRSFKGFGVLSVLTLSYLCLLFWYLDYHARRKYKTPDKIYIGACDILCAPICTGCIGLLGLMPYYLTLCIVIFPGLLVRRKYTKASSSMPILAYTCPLTILFMVIYMLV